MRRSGDVGWHGDVPVDGTGGSNSGIFNYGVLLNGANSRILRVAAGWKVNGQGGGGTGAGSQIMAFGSPTQLRLHRVGTAMWTLRVRGTSAGSDNYGVLVGTGGQVTSGGSGTVTVKGTGSSGTGLFNFAWRWRALVLRSSRAVGAVVVEGQGRGGGLGEPEYRCSDHRDRTDTRL